jgi:osmotically-inducible protein OsmY
LVSRGQINKNVTATIDIQVTVTVGTGVLMGSTDSTKGEAFGEKTSHIVTGFKGSVQYYTRRSI